MRFSCSSLFVRFLNPLIGKGNLNNLDKCKNFRDDSDDDTMMEEDLTDFGGESSTASALKEERAKMLIEETLPVDLKALELELQSLCLPFLRVASLFHLHK